MADVFISYCHVSPDETLAAELAGYLAEHQVRTFLDKQILIGEKWAEMVDHELSSCRVLIVLLSATSIRSDMVRQEIKQAQQLKKILFPIRIDYDGALPYDLAAYLDPIHYKLWRRGEPFADVCQAVLDGIRGLAVKAQQQLPDDGLRRLNEVTESRGAPLPAADPRLETGALKLDSPFYVQRQADVQARALAKLNGETILIKGPRQVGKTSLAARALNAVRGERKQSCYIDFQLIDDTRFKDLGTLLVYMASRLAKEFHSPVKPKDVWDDMLGDTDSLTAFVEEGILTQALAPVTVCLDEVDNVFSHSWRDGFFGMLRSWHNRRATHPAWNKFNLMISHSTEPSLFIRDLSQSPFNVGTILRLGDFTDEEVRWLNERHNSPLKNDEDLGIMKRLLGGHPYLVRQALYTLSVSGQTMARLDQDSGGGSGPFGDHLRRLLWVLKGNDSLRACLRQVVRGRECRDESDFQKLVAAGILAGDSRRNARMRCDLYTRYLGAHI